MKMLRPAAAMESEWMDHRWRSGFGLRGHALRNMADPTVAHGEENAWRPAPLPGPIILDSIGDQEQAGPESENTPASRSAGHVRLICGADLAGHPILS